MKCRECKVARVSLLDWLCLSRCGNCFLEGYIKWKDEERKVGERSNK